MQVLPPGTPINFVNTRILRNQYLALHVIMVRYCAVPNCINSDKTILSHRLPRKPALFNEWVTSLKIDHLDPVNLLNNHTVCCLHFDESAYRNAQSNHLNFIAVPTLNPKDPRIKQPNRIEDPSHHVADEEDVVRCEVIASSCDSEDCIVEDYSEIDLALYANSQPPPDTDSSNNDETSEHGEDLVSVETMSNDDLWVDLEHVLVNKPRPNKENAELIKDIIEHCNDYDDDLIEVMVNEDSCDDIDEVPEKEVDTMQTPRIELVEAATQVEEDDLERSDEEDLEYAGVSRKALIIQLKAQQRLIAEQQKKLETFQIAQANLLSSMDAFKSLMGNQ